mmetsp:Transcript_7213/g.20498  ORF Transcript_7213/g.20498 Transcript_7213/m.20498 type:complete len:234 (-) Transcript_7213:238-939(-)
MTLVTLGCCCRAASLCITLRKVLRSFISPRLRAASRVSTVRMPVKRTSCSVVVGASRWAAFTTPNALREICGPNLKPPAVCATESSASFRGGGMAWNRRARRYCHRASIAERMRSFSSARANETSRSSCKPSNFRSRPTNLARTASANAWPRGLPSTTSSITNSFKRSRSHPASAAASPGAAMGTNTTGGAATGHSLRWAPISRSDAIWGKAGGRARTMIEVVTASSASVAHA